MARATFGIGELSAAKPGLSRLASALVGGDQAFQQGYDGTVNAQTKIAQTLAEIRAQNAAAGAHDATAANTRAKTGLLDHRPDLFEEQVANQAGSDIPTVQAYRRQLHGGPDATVAMGPPTEQGTMGATPLPADGRSKIAAALQQFLPLLANSGDLKPDDLAQASAIFQTMGLTDRAINDPSARNAIAGGVAAGSGKALYNQNADGAVLDQYGGALATDNPMARASIGLRGAQAGEASAKGGLARAQAQEVGAPKFDAASGTIVDARTATSRPVMGADGKPMAGKGGTLSQEQANALGFGSRMQASEQILSGLAAGHDGKAGVNQPGVFKRAVGTFPVVGDIAAQMANGTQSDEQQQVEQAQRDFINAQLRRESGAAISSGEFANAAQQYFPQPGDKPGVLKQKAANRNRVIQAMFAAVPPGQRTLPDAPALPAAPQVVAPPAVPDTVPMGWHVREH